MNLRIAIYAAENFLIALGFLYLGLGVIPRATRTLPLTRIGGILLFLAAAAAHIDTGITVLRDNHAFFFHHVGSQWRAIAFHGVQMIALYVFVTGLYLEWVKWGPFNRPTTLENDALKAEIERRFHQKDEGI